MISGYESAEVLYATMADIARNYADRVAAERLTVGRARDGVTVVIGADGFLVRVDVAGWLRRRYAPEPVARLVLDTIRKAELAAGERRRELAVAEAP
jgi:hypothetical protein